MILRSLIVFITLFSFFSSTSVLGQNPGVILSDDSKISLLTCSPGDELYSVFGHSAIRVNDSINKIDIVFNYGTFDFSDPNFYTNFVKGRLNYILSLAYFNRFMMEYDMEDRWIYEQVLNIDKNQRQFLFDSLLTNYQPENRYYLYDFFMDNCATRIRDIFVEGIPQRIDFDYRCFEETKSFRQLLQPYLVQKPWARFGIDLALGMPADRTAAPWDFMFLPDHMLAAFQHASFVNDSISQPFASEPEAILVGKTRNEKKAANQPLFLFLFVLIIGISFSVRDFGRTSLSNWFDAVLFGLVGILGILITFLWFFTDHQVTPWNLNILWAHPLHLFAIILLFSNRLKVFADWYFKVNTVLLLILLVFWYFIPQQLPWAAYPIVILLALRYGLRAFRSGLKI